MQSENGCIGDIVAVTQDQRGHGGAALCQTDNGCIGNITAVTQGNSGHAWRGSTVPDR